MEVYTILILMAFCLGASFVQRVSGFGFGIFIMTVLPYLMPSYGEATTLSGLLAAVQSLVVAIKMRRYISWRRLMPILITFVVVSYFAVKFVSSVDDHLLKRILGCVLIMASVYFYFVSGKIHLPPTVGVQVGMGTLSGLMGGLCAMQGPPAVLYFLESERSKEQYLAISQAYFCIGNVMMTLFRAKSGFLTIAVGEAWCYGIASVVVGTWLGGLVFDKMPISVLRKVVYGYMAASGVVALLM